MPDPDPFKVHESEVMKRSYALYPGHGFYLHLNQNREHTPFPVLIRCVNIFKKSYDLF